MVQDSACSSTEFTPRLEFTSRIPLYEQLADAIRHAIRAGTLVPGTMLLPEPEFAARLRVSRQTVSQALTLLAKQGLVGRRRGVGTVILAPMVEQPLGELYSFVRSLTAQGHVAGTRLLGYHHATHDDEASAVLTGEPDGVVFEANRLRLVDGEPFVVETLFLPFAYGQQIPLERLAQAALYDLLQEYCDITITQADETLRPVALAPPDATLLGLPVGAPAFLVERIGYTEGRAVEVRRSVIRGDRFRFRVHLEAAAHTLAPE